MEKARVGIFEDDMPSRILAKKMIELCGHSVVFEASNMEEVHSAIEDPEYIDLDVAIVDGNLSPKIVNGEDGAIITRLLREKYPEIVIIGYSGAGDVAGAHHNIGKNGIEPNIIADIIADI